MGRRGGLLTAVLLCLALNACVRVPRDPQQTPTGIELHRHHHVIAIPPGENAWLMRLDRFRLPQTGLAARLREQQEAQR